MMSTIIVNLTPHVINLYKVDELTYNTQFRSYVAAENTEPCLVIEAEVSPARCKQEVVDREPLLLNGLSVRTVGISFGEIESLPAEVTGTYYVVSAIVANAGRSQGRKDLLVPTELVRDSNGAIIGCAAFAAE